MVAARQITDTTADLCSPLANQAHGASGLSIKGAHEHVAVRKQVRLHAGRSGRRALRSQDRDGVPSPVPAAWGMLAWLLQMLSRVLGP